MVLSVVIVGVAFFAMSGISESTREVETVAYRLNAVSAIRSSIQSVTTNVREVVLAQGEVKKKAVRAEIEQAIPLVDAEMQKIGATTRLANEWRELTETWEKHKAVAARIIDLSIQDTNAKALVLVQTECNPLRRKEMELFRTVFKDQEGMEEISTLMLSIPTDVREIVLSVDMEEMGKIKGEIEKTSAEIDARMAALGPRISLRSDWATLEDAWKKHKVVAARIVDLSLQNTNGQAIDLLANECNPLRQAEDRIFTDIMKKQEQFLADVVNEANANSRSAVITLFSVAGASIVLGLFLSWLTISRLSRALMHIIDRLNHSSVQVFEAASSISASSDKLASGATEQAAALEESSAAL
jgi:CHASE3 domain sensor protein